jgi:hypothetical protein
MDADAAGQLWGKRCKCPLPLLTDGNCIHTFPVESWLFQLFLSCCKILDIPGRFPPGKYEAIPATVIGKDGRDLAHTPSIPIVLITAIRAG